MLVGCQLHLILTFSSFVRLQTSSLLLSSSFLTFATLIFYTLQLRSFPNPDAQPPPIAANMPPKKETAPANTVITGFDVKETRILAAAFVSSLGADKVRRHPTDGHVLHASALTLTLHSTTGRFLPSSLASPRARSRSFGRLSRTRRSSTPRASPPS